MKSNKHDCQKILNAVRRLLCKTNFRISTFSVRRKTGVLITFYISEEESNTMIDGGRNETEICDGRGGGLLEGEDRETNFDGRRRFLYLRKRQVQ